MIAFLGGVSAAASMVVVETTALSIMVCNDVVMPALLRVKSLGLAQRPTLRGCCSGCAVAPCALVMALGYLYMRHDSAQVALVSIGLMSFVAVAQFAPALLGGLFWRGATKAGAIAGISVGSLVWCYTLFIPSFTQVQPIADFVAIGPFGIDLLRPYALFGLVGLDPVTQATFWSLLANIGALARRLDARPRSVRSSAPTPHCSSMPTIRAKPRRSGAAPRSSPISIRSPPASSAATVPPPPSPTGRATAASIRRPP